MTMYSLMSDSDPGSLLQQVHMLVPESVKQKILFLFTLKQQQITYSRFFISTHGEIQLFLCKIIQIYFLSIQ